MQLVRLFLAFVAVVVFGWSPGALAVSFPGSELLGISEVSFPTRSPTLTGDSLRFGAGTSNYEVLMRWDIVFAGSALANGESIGVDVIANLRRQSVDVELQIALWDGSSALGAGLFDNEGGGVQAWLTTSGGVHTSEIHDQPVWSYGSIFAVGNSGDVAVNFQISPTETLISSSSSGASIQFSTAPLDFDQGLSVLMFIQSPHEQVDLNSIQLEVIPEPSTALLLGIGLSALAVRRKQR